MNTLKNLFILISKFINNNPLCIETGIQHNFEENISDYHSTLNMIEYLVKPKNGTLYSFDIEEQNIAKCMSQIMNSKKVDYFDYIKFITGDSVHQLKVYENIFKKTGIDLVFLDSKDFDEEHMLNEFMVIESHLKNNSIIMCDDIHNPSSTKYKKAVPYIKQKVDLWFEYNTPTGLFVGIKH